MERNGGGGGGSSISRRRREGLTKRHQARRGAGGGCDHHDQTEDFETVNDKCSACLLFRDADIMREKQRKAATAKS